MDEKRPKYLQDFEEQGYKLSLFYLFILFYSMKNINFIFTSFILFVLFHSINKFF